MAETRDLLIEIGTEELPPKALELLARGFGLYLRTKLGALGLVSAQEERIYFSPRRLAVLIPNVALQQADRVLELFGPPVSAAHDKDGKPTKAAEGFAKKVGANLEQLQQKDGKLFFKSLAKGRAAAELIPEIVKEALEKLPIPKRMRWGTGEAQFVRPVHWVVMLLGDKVIDSEILGVKTGRKTYGHRHMQPQAIELNNAGEYVEALRKAKVWLDGNGQGLREEISTQVQKLAAEAGGVALNSEADSALVKEIAALVEWPVALQGGFDAKFLALPEEVLIITLEHHQRYFPLRDPKSGKLLPKFVFVANIDSREPSTVVHGNERVIVPRLTDAMFFWHSDGQRKLENRRDELDRVTFQKDLGSVGEKSKDVAKLAGLIAPKLGGDAKLAERAGLLAKCDLLTGLVGEFPELQGTIGKYLARRDGEPPEVSDALEEQYLPRFAGDRLPASKTGQSLALADKLDTVCRIYGAGLVPTGDRDPFGLRRQALGTMRILIERGLDLNVAELIGAAIKQLKSVKTEFGPAAIQAFFVERLRAYYEEQGIRPDVFAAVESRGSNRPLDLDRRLKALQAFLALPEAKNLIAANKRIANILKQAGETERKLDASLFETSAEISLHATVEKLQKEVAPFLAKGDYTSVLTHLAALRAPVDKFFDEVMVMDENAAVRDNRLALLAELRALFLHTADLSLIQVEA